MNNNFLYITGNCVRDAETKTTSGGKKLTTLTIAVNHSKDNTSFFDVNYWGEFMARKGQALEIIGNIKQERWQDKQSGEARSKVSITAKTMIFKQFDKKEDDGDNQEERPQKQIDQKQISKVSSLSDEIKSLLRTAGFDTVHKADAFCKQHNYDEKKIKSVLTDDIPF